MQVGIFDKVFARDTPEATLGAVAQHGAEAIQLHLSIAGLDELPEAVDPAVAARIRRAAAERGVAVAAVSGTFNMAHPDPAHRRDGLRRLDALAAAGRDLGTGVITLCTGTRNRESMWRPHPDNGTPEAWRDLVETVAAAAESAERHGIDLALEPEVANVVDSAEKARRLLDEVRSPRLKVCIDGANVFHRGDLARMAEVLDRAFDLVGDAVVMAHAKDLDRDGQAGHLPAGHGRLDYPRYVGLLERIGYRGAVVLHGLTEAQAPGCIAFLRGVLPPRAGGA